MGIHGFWMNVYIAAIRAGESPMRAKYCADEAVKAFKALDVDSL